MIRSLVVTALLALAVGSAAAAPIVLAGTVLGPDGKPVPGAQVQAMDVTSLFDPAVVSATTNEAGRFSVTLKMQAAPIPGWRYPLLAMKEGLAAVLAAGQPDGQVALRLGPAPPPREVLVRTVDDKPVVGAEVQVSGLFSSGEQALSLWLPLPRTALLRATTDAEGKAVLAGLPAELTPVLSVTAEGLSRAGGQAEAERGPLELVLEPEATIAGQLRRAGQPVAGATVYASLGGVGDVATSAADGAYVLRHLPPGQAYLGVEAEGLAPPLTRSLSLTAGEHLTGLDFDLSPGAVVRGRVTGEPDGAPVQGAIVAVEAAGEDRPLRRPALVDPQGRYEIRVCPGEITLRCRVMAAGPDNADSEPSERRLKVAEGQVVEGADFTVRLPEKLKGRVLLPDGEPAGGARVTVLSPALPAPQTITTGADGRFETGSAISRSEATGVVAVTADLAGLALCSPDRPLEVRLQPAAWLQSQVLDDRGEPLPRTKVTVRLWLGPVEDDTTAALPSTEADEKGQLRLGPLPAGASLHAAPDTALSHLVLSPEWKLWEPLSLRPGQTLVLPPLRINPQGRSLPVFVGDLQQHPIAGAKVYTALPEKPFVTDATGRVELHGLPVEGKITILAVHPTDKLYAGTTVDPDVGPWPGLLLQPPGQAAGRLLPQGKPAVAVRYRCEPADDEARFVPPITQLRPGTWGRAATDAEGRFTAGPLVPGLRYRLVVWAVGTGLGETIGQFTAAGGPDLQQLGAYVYEEPEPGE